MFKSKIFLVVLYVCLQFNQLWAQEYPKNEDYITKFVNSADSLLKVSKTISVFEAKNAANLAGEHARVNLKKTSSKKMVAHEVYENAKKATVIVGSAYLCTKCAHTHVNPASGYIIDGRAGIVVTNYHVLSSYAYMPNGNKGLGFMVRLADGRTYPVKAVLAASEQNDLAILQLDTHGDVLPALGIAPKAQIGDTAYVLGHPHSFFYHFSQGIVTHKHTETMVVNGGNSVERKFMLISADYGVGSSGGPVMDERGNVIGTVSATRTLNYSNENPVVQMVLKKTIPVESLLELIKTK